MITGAYIDDQAARVQAALKAAYGVGGQSLAQTLRRVGRRLPAGLRTEAQRIVEAQSLGGNPKLLRRIDPTALTGAEARLVEHLGTVDRRAARIDRWLGMAGVIAFNLFVVLGLFVIWVLWRGSTG